jgi:beta-xylosidase
VGDAVSVGRWIVLVLVGSSLAGCTADVGDDPAVPGQREQTLGPEAGDRELSGEPEQLRPGVGLLLGVPIFDGDFADPFVLAAGNAYYAYSTNTVDANVPLLVARDSTTARYVGDVLPDLPEWSEAGFVWAPAVVSVDDGYVLYYATRVAGTQTQCISRAVAELPEGPFVDESSGPMVCQRDLGGSIDPAVGVDDDGGLVLLFKNDGNCCGMPTSIWSQPLSGDGLEVVGEPSELLVAEPGWEGDLIEGPSMVAHGDEYLLFYSANAWDTEDYAVGWARCESLTGPCERIEDGPWMSSELLAYGPGGQEFFEALGDVWMAYHGWTEKSAAPSGGQRRLYVDVIEFDDGVPKRVGARNTGLLLFGVALAIALVAVGSYFTYRALRRRRDGRAGSEEEAPG